MTGPDPAPLFLARGLVKLFPAPGGGLVRALDGVDLAILPGECLVIAGANGSGKTILVRILTGLLDPSAGDLLFKGAPLDRGIRREAGLVFQDAGAQIIGETLMEDTAFGPRNLGCSAVQAARRAEEALEAVGLAEKRDHSPRRLSGGEKRRLAVAGVLAMGCAVIALDEPFANLDWPGVVQVLELLRRLKGEGKTLIILTHELEKILALANRLVILGKGRVLDQGPPGETLDRLKPEYGVRDPRKSCAAVEDCTWLD